MAKRKAEHSSIGEVLKDFISSRRKLEKGLNKVSAQEAWHTVMGEAISKYTTQVLLERDTLFCTTKLFGVAGRIELWKGKDPQIIK